MRLTICATGLTVLITVANAHGAQVAFDFTGTVTSALGSYSSIPIGTSVTGHFQYDTDTPDALPGDTTFGRYNHLVPFPNGFTVDVGGIVAFANDPAEVFQVNVGTALGATFDDHSIFIGPGGFQDALVTSGAFTVKTVSFLLENDSSPVFPDDNLPLSLTLSDFPDRNAFIDDVGSGVGRIFYSIDTLTSGEFSENAGGSGESAIPEPSTIILAILGLLALGWHRWQPMKNRSG